MAERLNFTKQSVASIAPPASGRRYVYDTKVPGLCVCVTAAGARSS